MKRLSCKRCLILTWVVPLGFLLGGLPGSLHAVEVAPRISDREIIEALGELRAGQAVLIKRIDGLEQRINQVEKGLNQRLNQVEGGLNKRIDQVEKGLDQRINQVEKGLNQRIDQVEKGLNLRIQQLDQRMADTQKGLEQRLQDLSQRIDDLWDLTLILVAGILGLVGFVVWDRKTAMRPLEQRMVRLEQEVRDDIEAHHGPDSEIKRILRALQALAQEDERVAHVLRQFSLM